MFLWWPLTLPRHCHIAMTDMGEGGSIPFMGMLGELFPKAQFMITGVLGPKSNGTSPPSHPRSAQTNIVDPHHLPDRTAHGPNEFLHIEMGKGTSLFPFIPPPTAHALLTTVLLLLAPLCYPLNRRHVVRGLPHRRPGRAPGGLNRVNRVASPSLPQLSSCVQKGGGRVPSQFLQTNPYS